MNMFPNYVLSQTDRLDLEKYIKARIKNAAVTIVEIPTDPGELYLRLEYREYGCQVPLRLRPRFDNSYIDSMIRFAIDTLALEMFLGRPQ